MTYLYQKPVEMPRGTHYGSDYWIVYSFKLKRMVHLYSMLEYANFITLEMNPTVEYFCEQPLKIEYQDTSSSKRNTIFDFWVYYIDSTHEFQEVKYSSELIGKTDSVIRSQNQISFQRLWCENNAHNYKVITEKELYSGQFTIQNLGLLHSHLLRYNKMSKYSAEKLHEILCKKHTTIGEIYLSKVFPENCELGILAYQFYIGNIDMNIKDRPLDNYTEVTLCEKRNILFK